MTLLGQPKINSIPTQKIIPADNQNGRVPLRTNTQTISMPERSDSTISRNSVPNTFDTKKVKENHERIAKQLEVGLIFFGIFLSNVFVLKKLKAELDRQRAKGPNHNPTKISFIENQIRQYEQQINEIKRRIDSVEVIPKSFSLP